MCNGDEAEEEEVVAMTLLEDELVFFLAKKAAAVVFWHLEPIGPEWDITYLLLQSIFFFLQQTTKEVVQEIQDTSEAMIFLFRGRLDVFIAKCVHFGT